MLLSIADGGTEKEVENCLIATRGSIGSKRSSGPVVRSTAGPPAVPSLTTVIAVGLSVDEMLMSGVSALNESLPAGYGGVNVIAYYLLLQQAKVRLAS